MFLNLKYIKTLILSYFLISFCTLLKAQNNDTISILNIRQIDNKIFLRYNLLPKYHSDVYTVKLFVEDSLKSLYQPRSVYGDIGIEINGSNNNLIVWNLSNEHCPLQDSLSFVMSASRNTFNSQNFTKALTYSAFFPGVGLYRYDRRKPYWLLGVITYGLISTSIYYDYNASTNYMSYNHSEKIDERAYLKNKWKSDRQKSIKFFACALGVWSLDKLWLSVNSIRVKNYYRKLQSGYYE